MHTMAGREIEAVGRAVARYQTGETLRSAAATEGVNVSTLGRALNRRGIERRGPPKGPEHHAYIDGRTTARQPGSPEPQSTQRQQRPA
jgi:hypothetical protein